MQIKFYSVIIFFVLFGLSSNLFAQIGPALFKDLNPGPKGSTIEQFTNVNGTMYFYAVVDYRYQIWKSDGTIVNTVMVKDSVVTTNSGAGITFLGSVGDTLFYAVNQSSFWKTYGTTVVQIDTVFGVDCIIGNKFFFRVGNSLWVSDGNKAGTHKVISMAFIGVPVVYKDKIYFQGSTVVGNHELYSSDGTLAGTSLVKEIYPNTSIGGGSDPEFFIIYNNELYFYAFDGTNRGIFKTDGTAAGTVNITNGSFNSDAKIFQNNMYFSVAGNLWKSDGTKTGTTLVKNLTGGVTGVTSNYLFTGYMKSLAVPPYYGYDYWKSDGTTAGTVKVSDSLGASVSFISLNNKMYNSVSSGIDYSSGLWETDGTEAGTKILLPSGYLGYPFVFKNTVFFKNYTSAAGYELWYYKTGIASANEHRSDQLELVYSLSQNNPNPFNPSTNIEFQIPLNGFVTLKVYDGIGREVAILANEQMNAGSYNATFNGTGLASGVYFYRMQVGNSITMKKMMLLK